MLAEPRTAPTDAPTARAEFACWLADGILAVAGWCADGPAGDHGLHLIYGPNEAGKTSALRAVSHLLFGFPVRTPDDFVHPYDQLRVGAVQMCSSDDLQANLATCRRLIEQAVTEGAQLVGTASDGESAINLTEALSPDLLLLDIAMPGLDGIEVCRRLRAAQDWTPVLFVTARDDEVDRINREAFTTVTRFVQSQPHAAAQALDVLSIARNMERVADHATNIAEDVIFWVRGADVRHGAGQTLAGS